MSTPEADPARRLRSRARLLEFLKFRVLASQEAFFEAWRLEPDCSGAAVLANANPALPPLDLSAFRQWLQPLWPEATALSDGDLRVCLEQAHGLYVDPPSRRPA